MAEYPTLTKTDLALYSGRSLASYSPYADQAIIQAILLFKLNTCLAGLPDNANAQQLATLAILAMADTIYLEQPYQKAKASPFNSESIGSYSYSKTFSRSASAAQQNKGTGVPWFDQAVQQLGVCDSYNSGLPTFGGIEVFENDGLMVHGAIGANVRLLSPKDLHQFRLFGYDPAPGYNGISVPGGPEVYYAQNTVITDEGGVVNEGETYSAGDGEVFTGGFD